VLPRRVELPRNMHGTTKSKSVRGNTLLMPRGLHGLVYMRQLLNSHGNMHVCSEFRKLFSRSDPDGLPSLEQTTVR